MKNDSFLPKERNEAMFFQLNPRGLLPVLIDEQEGATLFETGGILVYLADKHSTLGLNDEGSKGRSFFFDAKHRIGE